VAGFAAEWFLKSKLHVTAASESGGEDCGSASAVWEELGHDVVSNRLAVICAWMMWRQCLRR
jgi:hypothetical protein